MVTAVILLVLAYAYLGSAFVEMAWTRLRRGSRAAATGGAHASDSVKQTKTS